ncbi:hypothetical protein FIV04_05015 [Vibrio sp. THAF190c]|jgi:hypothetical protein|nr:hypothetical protein FIV04_05015 [Vibrio sp. THAF190c]
MRQATRNLNQPELKHNKKQCSNQRKPYQAQKNVMSPIADSYF